MSKKAIRKPQSKKNFGKKFSPKNFFFSIKSNIKVRTIIIGGIVVAVWILLGVFKNQFVAANVNGKQISKAQLIRELEKKEGRRTLDSLITETLILQEADKKGAKASEQEINDELKKIEKNLSDQGQNLDELLVAQNFTREELKKQITIQLVLKKMLGGETKISDKEIEEYIEKNKESVPEGQDMEEFKKQVRQQLEQQKGSDKVQEFIRKLEQNAKIEYYL